MFIHYATLTDEAGGYQRGVADGYTGANNEIGAFNTRPDMYRCFGITVDRTIFKI